MVSPFDTVPGKIFIGGISSVTTQDAIQRYFEQFGELSDCIIMQDKTTGKSRGFGFVTYRDSSVIEKVLTLTHVVDGKELDCKKAIRREQLADTKEEPASQTKKLFVGGLLQTTTEDDLRAYFEQFGMIDDLIIMVDKLTGKSRGFGFVTYRNEISVEKVLERYYENKICGKWVECKKAQPKQAMTTTNRRGGGKREIKEVIPQQIEHQNFEEPRELKPEFYQNPTMTNMNALPQNYQRNQPLQNNFGDYSFPSSFNSNSRKNSYEPNFHHANPAFTMNVNPQGYPQNSYQMNYPSNDYNNFYVNPNMPPTFTGKPTSQTSRPFQGLLPNNVSPLIVDAPLQGYMNNMNMPLREKVPNQTNLIPTNTISPFSGILPNQEEMVSQIQQVPISNPNYGGNLGGVYKSVIEGGFGAENVVYREENNAQNLNLLNARQPGMMQDFSSTPFSFSALSSEKNPSR